MRGIIMNIKEKQLKPEHLCGAYAEIASLLSVEAALKLHDHFRGTQVSFPVEFYSREYIFSLIIKEYNGANIRELATKYGYTEKWIRKIVKNNEEL